jgi:hypothetical protein
VNTAGGLFLYKQDGKPNFVGKAAKKSTMSKIKHCISEK